MYRHTCLICLHDAATLWARFRGWKTWEDSKELHAVWLRPCRAVHTWGLARTLDICFLDQQDRPLRLLRGVQPGKIRTCRNARSVLEAPPGCLPDLDRFAPWRQALQRMRQGAACVWIDCEPGWPPFSTLGSQTWVRGVESPNTLR